MCTPSRMWPLRCPPTQSERRPCLPQSARSRCRLHRSSGHSDSRSTDWDPRTSTATSRTHHRRTCCHWRSCTRRTETTWPPPHTDQLSSSKPSSLSLQVTRKWWCPCVPPAWPPLSCPAADLRCRAAHPAPTPIDARHCGCPSSPPPCRSALAAQTARRGVRQTTAAASYRCRPKTRRRPRTPAP